MAWRTKIAFADTADIDIRVGNDVSLRLNRIAGGVEVVVDAPPDKTIIREKVGEKTHVSRRVE